MSPNSWKLVSGPGIVLPALSSISICSSCRCTTVASSAIHATLSGAASASRKKQRLNGSLRTFPQSTGSNSSATSPGHEDICLSVSMMSLQSPMLGSDHPGRPRA
eukprot:5500409-Amphidinium_carterae.1